MSRENDRRPGEVEALVRHAGFVRAVARAVLGDAHAAEDVAQDAFVVAMERPPARPDRARGWLAGIARNLARMRRRGDARRHAREVAAPRDGFAPAAADAAAKLEAEARVGAALRALPEAYRTVVVLRYYDDLAPAEIARRLDVPVATVYTRLRRAIERLRAALEEGRQDRGLLLLAGLLGPRRTGALLMGTKTKLLAAAAAAVRLATTATLLPGRRPDPPAGPETGPVPPAAGAEAAAGADRSPEEGAAVAAAPEPEEWRLDLRVVDERGEAIAGAHARFLDDRGKTISRVPLGKDGRGEIRAAGAGSLVVSAEGYAPARIEETGPRPDGEPVTVVLGRGAAIAGEVLDQDKNRAVRVRVTAVLVDPPAWLEGSRLGSDSTGANGTFRVEGLLPGRYRLLLRVRPPELGAPPDPAPVVPAGTTDVRIRLGPLGSFAFVLRDRKTGEPVDTRVLLDTRDEDGEWQCRPVIWGGHSFEVDVVPGRESAFRIRALGYAPALFERLVADGPEPRRVEVLLDPDPAATATAVLLLRDDAGHAVERVQVFERLNGIFVGGPDRVAPGGLLRRSFHPGREIVLRIGPPGSGEEGRFLRPREVRFRLEPGETRKIPVELRRGGVVAVEYPSARVEVGEGAFLTPVHLRDADGALLRITARHLAPGRAEFRGVPPGPVTVEVGRRDGSTAEKRVDVRAGAVTRVGF